MKKIIITFLLAIMAINLNAYPVITIQDSISTNTHWTCNNQYLLKGYIYVTAGHTLTIDPGTIIKGDKSTKGTLIIERGARILAMGTSINPIIFTSNQLPGYRSYGDWGGVIICGNAPTNWLADQAQVEGGPRLFYGGSDPNDTSGEMHFCRIEFGGIAFSPNNEVNGLTLCGVGNGTQIDHIQVSFSGDDSYEWFGGTINTHHIVAYQSWDDDFDRDCGYVGKSQLVVAIRSADVSGSKSFESDSYLSGSVSGLTDTNGLTKGIFSNATIIGPVTNPGSSAYDANYVAAVLNSVISGWPCGLIIDDSSSSYGSTIANVTSGRMNFKNNIITSNNSTPNPKDIIYIINGARSLTPTTFSDTTAFIASSAISLGNPFFLTNPILVPNSGSYIVYGIKRFPSWTSADIFDTSPATYNMPNFPPDFATYKSNDVWFQRTNYVGAFGRTSLGDDNWMLGWCSFYPLNEPYHTICYHTMIQNNNIISKAVLSPNPIKDRASITLDIKMIGYNKIAILDQSGKLVQTIFDGDSISGEISFEFTLSDEIQNGNYILSMILKIH